MLGERLRLAEERRVVVDVLSKIMNVKVRLTHTHTCLTPTNTQLHRDMSTDRCALKGRRKHTRTYTHTHITHTHTHITHTHTHMYARTVLLTKGAEVLIHAKLQ